MKLTRTTAIGAVAVAALAATAAITVPATASAAGRPAVAAVSTTHAAPAPIRSGDPASAVDRVADFYGAYIDANYGTGMGSLGNDLRAHYLTKGLQKQLAAWEAKNHANGVLEAQSVPNGWAVTQANAGAGHVWSTVVLTWGTGKHVTHTTLTVQSDLATGLISGIK
ncbi:hypothetical protein [Streptacidiphilus sp. P02-A3a]|uniref:hypothetical protein n=1 Tax=Streptacidiphilus sp. P02-A3a TaxID=2704468 RepID=UPI001CDC4866|nr:hypothetical protein [Streptacidiphilus sp. P02-A3a]